MAEYPWSIIAAHQAYDKTLPHWSHHQLVTAEVVAALGTAARVLDAGCGTGMLASSLAECGCDVTGVDLNPDMIGVARGRVQRFPGRLRFRVQDAGRLPYPDSTFDGVLSVNVVFSVEDPERYVAELTRVLRVGGKVIIAGPTPDASDRVDALIRSLRNDLNNAGRAAVLSEELAIVEHANRAMASAGFGWTYWATEMARLLAGCGFEVEESHERLYDGSLFFVAARKAHRIQQLGILSSPKGGYRRKLKGGRVGSVNGASSVPDGPRRGADASSALRRFVWRKIMILFRSLWLLSLLVSLLGQSGCSRPGTTDASTLQHSETADRAPGVPAVNVLAPGVPKQGDGRVADPALAATLAEGVATVTRKSDPGSAPLVVVLEERHNSRLGQLQHAVVLVRMHEQHGMKHIVLEGYLKGDPEIRTDWFAKRVLGGHPEARASIAIEFLERGEISAAEFVKLVYPETVLHAAESREHYEVEPPDGFPMAEYLQKIAAVDPQWALEKAKPYQSVEEFKAMSGDKKAQSAKEIKQYAEANGIAIAPTSVKQMQQYITFFEQRMASNGTIAQTVNQVLAIDSAALVAVNIGADHSEGLASLLGGAERAYAMISPFYFPSRDEQGDLSEDMYDRKNRRLPVFGTGLSKLLLEDFPPEKTDEKKPQPVIDQAWFQAEAELRGATSSLVEAVLGPPQPPNGGKAPFGLAEGDYDGQHIQLLLGETEYINAGDDTPGRLLIAARIKASGRKIWIGARWGDSRSIGSKVERDGRKTVEQIVKEAIANVEVEAEAPKRAEDAMGALQVDVNVRVIIGTEAGAVRRELLKMN